MRHWIASIALLPFTVDTVIAQGAEPELVPYSVPDYKGYVLSVDLPKDWERKIDPQRYWLVITVRPKGYKYSYGPVVLSVRVFKKPRTYESWIALTKKGFKYYPSLKYYDKGTNTALGRKTFYFTSSQKYTYEGKNKTEISKPTQKKYITVFDDHAVVRFELFTRHPDTYGKWSPLFEKMSRTVKIRPTRAVPPGQLSRLYTSPNVQVSRRRNYYLRVRFRLVLPPGWRARKVALRHADRSRERGRMVVDMTPAKPAPPGRDQRLTVAIEGMRVTTALGSNDYLAVGKAHVATILKDAKLVPTPNSAEWTGQIGFGFCLARKRVRRGSGTGKIYVATYVGTDKRGRKRKLRIYTAGGLTMACNVIYSADPKTFGESWPRIHEMISSLTTDPASPVLNVR